MRKTQALGPATGRSGSAPVNLASNWAPIALFTLAYIAVLAVLFAPEGYFLADPAATVASD